MKTNRIVIDTNVIASALIFSKTSLIYNNINHGDRFGCSKFCKSSLPHRV
jgi:hypothetical protein